MIWILLEFIVLGFVLGTLPVSVLALKMHQLNSNVTSFSTDYTLIDPMISRSFDLVYKI